LAEWRGSPLFLAKKEVENLMRIGFISPPVPGHFNPMSAVARQLQSRNHDVVVLSLSLIEPTTLVDEVLNNSIYRDNARKFQQTIAKTNGPSRAAALLEEAFGLTKKVSE
jgi:UDP:flavonoid glycosyltransferase YjiC (YdhE family)